MKSLSWWKEQRSSTRLAFALQVATRIGNAALSLWWTYGLVRSMGDSLYGLFISFQAITTLGGLGDLGMGTVVGIRVGHHLGDGNTAALKRFLAAARGAFASMGMLLFIVAAALSPWLPQWFGFTPVPGSGSLPVLFTFGALSAGVLVFSSYISSANYGAGNTVWPVLPMFILTQVAIGLHWFLARASLPLTIQYLPYLGSAFAILFLMWGLLRLSHPELATFWPLGFNLKEWQPLIMQSFWAYLWSIGNIVFLTVARMVVNAGFGSEAVAPYHLNNKLSELAFYFVVTAGFVSIPKLTQWLSSPSVEDRQRAVQAFRKLNDVQAFLGCAAAVVYLAANNLFITHWVGARYHIPLHWQFAFALSLAVTSGGSAAIALSSRCGSNGLKYSGMIIGLAAAVDIVVSLAAMRIGSVFGIALATALANSVMTLLIGRFVCRYLNVPFARWTMRNWFLPVALVATIYGIRSSIPETALGYTIVAVSALVLIVITAWLTNINWKFVRSELVIVQRMLGGKPD